MSEGYEVDGPDHETTPAELWRAANQALLVAKRPPKNQVVFYTKR